MNSSMKNNYTKKAIVTFIDVTFVFSSQISMTIANSILKIKLVNESMIYDNNETRTTYTKLINNSSTLWKNKEFLALSKDE